MPAAPEFPLSVREIAGVPVARAWPEAIRHARCTSTTRPRSSSGSPTCGVRRDPLRPEGLLEPGDPRPRAAARRAGRCRQRRRNPPGAGRRLSSRHGDPPPIVYTADIFDREALDLVVEHGHPRQLRLARHDRPARRARAGPRASRCGSTPASATATARRPTPAASNRSTASGTSSSTTACARADQHGLARHRPAHAHRLGHRPGASRARSAARWRRRRCAVGPHRSPRSAPAAACRCPIARARRYVDLDAYFELWDATRKRLEDAVRPHDLRWRSSRAATWSPRAATWSAEIRAVKQMGEQHVLSARRRLQQPGPADPVRRLSPDVDRARPTAARRSGRCTTSSSAARCANRATSSRRKRAATSARAQLPAAEVGDYLVIECAGAYGFVMGSQLQLQAAGRRSADRRRPGRT